MIRCCITPNFRQGPSSLYTFPGEGACDVQSTRPNNCRRVQKSTSMRQVLAKLSVAPYGGNYDVLRAKLKKLGLDTSHFLGRAWSRNRELPPKTPLEQYLEGARPVQSYKLKNRLLKQGVLTPVCVGCGLRSWLDQPIPLELDHVNGDNKATGSKTFVCYVRIATPSLRLTGARDAPGLSSGLQSPQPAVVLVPRI